MIRRSRITGFGLLIIYGLALLVWGQEPLPAIPGKEHRLPIQVRGGLVYIQARVNGSRAKLLVDSGSVLTTFTLKLVPTPSFDSRITINLAKGSAPAFRVPVELNLGDPELRERQCSFRQSAIVGDFKFMDADGLVGLDVLSQFKSVTFDFNSSILILEDR